MSEVPGGRHPDPSEVKVTKHTVVLRMQGGGPVVSMSFEAWGKFVAEVAKQRAVSDKS